MILKAQTIAKEFRQKETELIAILQELDTSKAYRATGYNSLFQFCVESLELTEHQAYQYITVARKCTEVPELMLALEDRRITVSKARKLSSVIAPSNQKAWIDLATTHSQKDLEKAVRSQCPLPPVADHLQILSKSQVKLQATLDTETTKMLERVMDLVSEMLPTGERNSINTSLKTLCEEYLKKHDPVVKAARALKRNRPQKIHSRTPLRKKIPATTRHQVLLRDQGQCRFHRHGRRCGNRKYLEFHHKLPVSLGGADTVENLVLLCSEHHKSVHLNKLEWA